ncbi:MAG: glycosyltransferase family 2 protein [Blastocatellia bacterium]|nr:glycosyltransferase family 2 protein [Blastocatellia bacterium]
MADPYDESIRAGGKLQSQMATISIALCTHNGEQFLQEQLDSFTAQRRRPDELIVCDDRSTDDTTRIIERFASDAPFKVDLIVNDKNLGSTRNFEKAVSLCKGALIFLSDQDDVWLPEKIERIESEFAANESVGLIFSDADLVDEHLKPLGRKLSSLTFHATSRMDLKTGKAFESLLNQNFVTGATAAFRSRYREVLRPTPGGVPNLIHDAWIALSIANEAPVVFIEEPLIKYRQHSSQQIGLRLDHEEDRKERYQRTIDTLNAEATRLRMLKQILSGLPDFQMPEEIDVMIENKLEYAEHCAKRMDLPDSRVSRAAPIIREMSTGRYGRFSRGLISALKDLVER